MGFLKYFFNAKPTKTLLIFIAGVLFLSRDPAIQKEKLFMSFGQILKRAPQPPKMPQKNIEIATNSCLTIKAATKKDSLHNFFNALHKLNKKKQKQVRIFHFGDSVIWADNITRRLRAHLNKDFGNGGRGLLPIAFQSPAYKLTGVQQRFSTRWIIQKLSTDQRHISNLGITLRSYTAPYGGAYSSFSFAPGEEISKLQLLKKSSPSGQIRLSLTLTNNKRKNFIFKASDKIELQLKSAISKMTITASKGVTLFGMVATKKQGIVYSPIIRKGIFAQDFLQLNEQLFIQQLRAAKPDLLIFQFGKNESGWNKFDIKKHHSGVERFITLAKKAAPNASILLISPAGRLNKYGGPLRLFPSIPQIIQTQKKLAHQYGAAFFNTMRALGGKNGLNELVRRGMAMTDYVHLPIKGGNLLANKIYTDLSGAYNQFLNNSNSGLIKLFSKQQSSKKEIRNAASSINFDTVAFIIFFIVIFFAYWMLYNAGMVRIFLLLIASYYFYMSWNPIFITLIIISTLVDYAAGFLIHKNKVRDKKISARFWLIASLCSNLGLLFFFKYFNLFADFINQIGILPGQTEAVSILLPSSLTEIFNTINHIPGHIKAIALILPAGISFYTFQTMSYSLDIYAGKLKPIKSLSKFALFVSFFPQLVAGPIVRARDFLPQLTGRTKFNPTLIQTGIFLILVGLFKKVVLSDYIAVNFVNRVFENPTMYSALENLLGIYGFALQIYCDFSGYSDIAIGAAAMLGFRLPLNFNSPYKAHNLQNFWHRWHISLSSWLRDYLYIPLGGSRKGKILTYCNLLITMLLGGLWHGPFYRFIIWGAIHGSGLAIVRFFQRLRKHPNPQPSLFGKVLGWFITFHFVCFAWIFFRAKNMKIAGEMLERLGDLTTIIPNVTRGIAIVLLGGFILHFIPNRIFEKTKKMFLAAPAPVQSLIMLLMAILFFKTATSELVPFIYFQF